MEIMSSTILLKIGIIGGGIGIVIFLVSVFFILKPAEPVVFKDIELLIKEIEIIPIDINNTKIKVTFSLINPNARSTILESLDYELFNNDIRIAASGVGRSIGNVIVGSSEGTYYIVGKSTLDVNNEVTIKRSKANEVFWEDMNDDTLNIRVKGRYIISTPQVESGKEYTFEKEITVNI